MNAPESAPWQKPQAAPRSFHFPKWYTDYIGAGGGGGRGRQHQTFQLTFLRRDGTRANPEGTRSQQQFPALRPARTLPDGFRVDASRSHRQPPLLPIVVPLGGKPSQQSLKLPAASGKYRLCVANGEVPPVHPALYSSIRVVRGGARLHAWQQAADTIPSAESIRKSIRLPPILIKKLA